jgi:predicted PurR-regulated permease PerM
MTTRDSPTEPLSEIPDPVVVQPIIDVPQATLAALTLLVVLGVATMLWAAQIVLIPIVLALLISYALDPVHRVLRRTRLPRAVTAAVVMFVTLGAVGAVGYSLRNQASAFVASLPDTARRVRAAVQDTRGAPSAITQVQRAANEIQRTSRTPGDSPAAPAGVTRVQVEATPFSARELIWWGTGGILAFAGQVVVVIVLVFYFLAAGDLYKRKIVKIIGSTLSEKRLTVEILNDIDAHIGRYLVARALVSAIVGVATWGAFWWLGMPEPGVWGLGAGLLNVIPYIGPIAIAAGAALVGFLHFGDGMHALIIGATASAIATVEGFLITPVMMGRAGRMNGAAVFISLSIWGFLWGLWGLLLAVPLTMAIKVVCDHVDDLHGISELLSE